MDLIESNTAYDLNLIFSDNVIRVVSVASPNASPFWKGTVIDMHVLEYHNKQKSKPMPETTPPSLRLPFMSELFPFILPLCREGCVLTPPLNLLREVYAMVDYVAGENEIWSDFAKYLSQPPFIMGIKYIPQPDRFVTHEACKFLNDHYLSLGPEEDAFYTRSLVEATLTRFEFRVSYFKYIGYYHFEFEAFHDKFGKVHLTSTEMLLLMLYRREQQHYVSTTLNKKDFSLEVANDSPHYRSFLHCQEILTTEWLIPLIWQQPDGDTNKYVDIYADLLTKLGLDPKK
jgi:hypothetical protein